MDKAWVSDVAGYLTRRLATGTLEHHCRWLPVRRDQFCTRFTYSSILGLLSVLRPLGAFTRPEMYPALAGGWSVGRPTLSGWGPQ
eukprot:1677063-Pyramimonas_sp.AAC.1